MKKEVPIWEKSNLTVEEAAAYFNIGMNKIRKLAADENCPFVLWVGSRCLIKKAYTQTYLCYQIVRIRNEYQTDPRYPGTF